MTAETLAKFLEDHPDWSPSIIGVDAGQGTECRVIGVISPTDHFFALRTIDKLMHARPARPQNISMRQP